MHYQFLNLNPLGEFEEDCVTRAISLISGIAYDTVLKKLEQVGDLFDCDKLCVCCYKFFLDAVLNYTRLEEFRGMTIGEFASICSKGEYLVRVEGHLTAVRNGSIYDIWDCSKEIVDIVWRKK